MKQTLKIVKRFYHQPHKSLEIKSIKVTSKQETSYARKSNETNENHMLSAMQEEKISLFSESSE